MRTGAVSAETSMPSQLLLVGQEEVPPAVKHGHGDAEAGAEFSYRMQRKEVFCQHPKDEQKAIFRVRDDDIREDGMGMPAACTAQPQDTDFPIDCLSIREISHGAHVRAMGDAVTFGAAPWTCLILP